jgi:hypothetical protein
MVLEISRLVKTRFTSTRTSSHYFTRNGRRTNDKNDQYNRNSNEAHMTVLDMVDIRKYKYSQQQLLMR